MKNFLSCFLLVAVFANCQVKANNEILNILRTANDLTLQEVNALQPLFNELQKQYDAIAKALAMQDETTDDSLPWQKEAIPEPDIEGYVNLLQEMLVRPEVETLNVLKYDTKLPSLEELMADAPIQTAHMTAEQIAELEDMQQIMQEALDEAQIGINELVQRALHIESEMLKLNKPKIVMYIYNALSLVFRYSAQLRRAAYCVYSHVPQLNQSLQHLNTGVECYDYTKRLLGKVEYEVIHTVGTIKKNVFDLAKVYKKIADKHSIVGKIITGVLNIFRIMRDVRETLTVTTKVIDELENQLPNAAMNSVACGLDFASTVPFMLETAFNVTTCITYIGTQTEEYEFLLPESERIKLDDSK